MSIVDQFGGDIQQAGLMQELLIFCQAPRTIEEVADHFDWHPQTAREKLWILKHMGKVKECNRKRGRMKLWQTSGSLAGKGEAIIITSTKSIPLSNFTQMSNRRRPVANIVAQALSYLYRRAYYRQQDQEDVTNVAKMGSLDPLLDVKTALMKVYLQQKTMTEALERMLLEMPELWQDGNPAIITMMGAQDRALIEEQVGDFEEYCRWLLTQ